MDIIEFLLLPIRVAKALIEQADWLHYVYYGRTAESADFGDGFWVPRWVFIPLAFVLSFIIVEFINLVRLCLRLFRK